MTELIVALDGPQRAEMMRILHRDARVDWFKAGPQAMMGARYGKPLTRSRRRESL